MAFDLSVKNTHKRGREYLGKVEKKMAGIGTEPKIK
jgi:hypothetical protein